MLLRSKTHLLLNLLLKLLLQEILTQAHQCPTHNHMIFTLMGIPLNWCPLEGIWTHLPYGAFIIPYNSFVSKYGNWHHLQTVQWLLLLDGSLKVKSNEHSDVRSIRQGLLLRVIIERRALISRNVSLRVFLSEVSECFSPMLQIKTGRSIQGVWKPHFSRESWMMLFMSANLKDSWFVIALPMSTVC